MDFETKPLREFRNQLFQKTGNLDDAYRLIESMPAPLNTHSKLWKLLVQKSLEELNFVSAEKAFLKCQDYQGIQFIKRI